MTRKIALIALLSMLAVTGLAVGGDSRSGASDRCGAGQCPVPCGSCSAACASSCPLEAAVTAAR